MTAPPFTLNTMTQPLPPDARRAQILAAAIEEAKAEGYQWITRDRVAARAGLSNGMVNRHFSTMVQLKRAVMREAVRLEILPLVAQGLADGNQHAKAAPERVKLAALATL